MKSRSDPTQISEKHGSHDSSRPKEAALAFTPRLPAGADKLKRLRRRRRLTSRLSCEANDKEGFSPGIRRRFARRGGFHPGTGHGVARHRALLSRGFCAADPRSLRQLEAEPL